MDMDVETERGPSEEYPTKVVKGVTEGASNNVAILQVQKVEVEVGQEAEKRVVIRSDEEDGKERCCICLMGLRDRTIAASCSHEFCFECIGIWANQSRRCPLCATEMNTFLLHNLSSGTPSKFHLPPLPSKISPFAAVQHLPSPTPCPAESPDQVQLRRRREIYQYELFAKHIGSNGFSGFTPNPTPRAIAADPSLRSRAALFLRRELCVFTNNTDDLLPYFLSLLRNIDIRSDPAIQLIRRALGDRYPRSAEQLSHELTAWLRSPYQSLEEYDEVVQYDEIDDISSSSSYSLSPNHHSIPRRSLSPRSFSPRSISPQSLPSRSPRDPTLADHFEPARSPPRSGARRWDEADSWVDPEFEEMQRRRRRERGDIRPIWPEQKPERRGRVQRRDRSRAKAGYHVKDGQDGADKRIDPEQEHDLLESQVKGMRAWADGDDDGVERVDPGEGRRVGSLADRLSWNTSKDVVQEVPMVPRELVIKGADERRRSLLERLALAKSAGPVGEAGNVHVRDDRENVSLLREKLVAEKRRKELRKALMQRKESK